MKCDFGLLIKKMCHRVPTVRQRVKLFEAIRDIPYAVNIGDEHKDASCWSKSRALCAQLERYGMNARLICCRVNWESMRLPEYIQSLVPKKGTQHWYVEVLIPETKKWVKVDPTWDRGLKNAGFPVAEWDGLTSTGLALKPIQHFSPEKSARLIQQRDKMPEGALSWFDEKQGESYRRLNAWIESQRRLRANETSSRPLRQRSWVARGAHA